MIIRSLLILALGFLIGWIIKPGADTLPAAEVSHTHDDQQPEIYTCSMHPQIRQGEPGKCPICGMDLIPLDAQEPETNPAEIRMSANAMALANIQSQVIGYGTPNREIRLNGKVQPDERLIYSQVSHIGGRVEDLMINFTGESIQKGQTIARIYSPELVTAQEELFVAEKIKETQPGLFEAAKEKLKNWKLTNEQIASIVESGEIVETFPILADVSGIVMSKKVNLGDYISRGTPLYEIVDLSKVWVLFDVYESDMSFVRLGNKIQFTISSIPGETFQGRINFLDPLIDPVTRVASARVEISNPVGRLKPEMFATGTLSAPIGNKKTENLLVPKSAVMWTGPRSVVYLKNEDERGITFQMQEVELGALVGDDYIIKSGLEAGSEIAIHGTFSIDAAAQLAGRPSMMNPLGSQTSGTRAIMINDQAKSALSHVFEQYFLLKNDLVADDYPAAQESSEKLSQSLQAIDVNIFDESAKLTWINQQKKASESLNKLIETSDILKARQFFKPLSDQFILIAKIFGPFTDTLYVQHCPMADSNQGADWLSQEKQIENPYFGSQMLKCGSVTEEIK